MSSHLSGEITAIGTAVLAGFAIITAAVEHGISLMDSVAAARVL